jgi:hypothetical protein
MTTIRELYEASIHYEESTLAHYILHLLQEGKVSLEDDESFLDLDQADHQVVAELIEKNQLGFSFIKVFSLKMYANTFVFIFAKSKQDAINLYQKKFRKAPLNCYEYPLDYRICRGNEFLSFRDLKKEMIEFPSIAGYFEKGKKGIDDAKKIG